MQGNRWHYLGLIAIVFVVIVAIFVCCGYWNYLAKGKKIVVAYKRGKTQFSFILSYISEDSLNFDDFNAKKGKANPSLSYPDYSQR
jgi:hypothetical protein